MKVNIFLIRHGITTWNQEKRFQGHQDIELSEIGIKQAVLLAEFLGSEKKLFSRVYSSDLRRASKTADIIAQKLRVPCNISADIRERDMGEWAGKTLEEVRDNYPNWIEIRNTGGIFGIEGTEDLTKRMMGRLQSIAQAHPMERVIVVCHGGAINSVLTCLSDGKYGIGITNLDNTSITHLEFSNEWRVISVGMTPHLDCGHLCDRT